MLLFICATGLLNGPQLADHYSYSVLAAKNDNAEDLLWFAKYGCI
jgi:hypothetical protein